MRSSVVFPQPDGPTIMKNSPCPISSDTSSTATSGPNDFVRLRMRIAGRAATGATLGRGAGAELDICLGPSRQASVAKFARADNRAAPSRIPSRDPRIHAQTRPQNPAKSTIFYFAWGCSSETCLPERKKPSAGARGSGAAIKKARPGACPEVRGAPFNLSPRRGEGGRPGEPGSPSRRNAVSGNTKRERNPCRTPAAGGARLTSAGRCRASRTAASSPGAGALPMMPRRPGRLMRPLCVRPTPCPYRPHRVRRGEASRRARGHHRRRLCRRGRAGHRPYAEPRRHPRRQAARLRRTGASDAVRCASSAARRGPRAPCRRARGDGDCRNRSGRAGRRRARRRAIRGAAGGDRRARGARPRRASRPWRVAGDLALETEFGDGTAVDRACTEAALVVSKTFRAQRVASAQMEPRSALAAYDAG